MNVFAGNELEKFLNKIKDEKAADLHSVLDIDESKTTNKSSVTGMTSSPEQLNSNHVVIPDTGQTVDKIPPLPEAHELVSNLKSSTATYVGQLTALLPVKSNVTGT